MRRKPQKTPRSSATGELRTRITPQMVAATAAGNAPARPPPSPIAARTTPATARDRSPSTEARRRSPVVIAIAAATAPSQAMIGATTETAPLLKATKPAWYPQAASPPTSTARRTPRAVQLGGSTKRAAGAIAATPIRTEPNTTAKGPTLRVAWASHTSGTPQHVAAVRPSNTVSSMVRLRAQAL